MLQRKCKLYAGLPSIGNPHYGCPLNCVHRPFVVGIGDNFNSPKGCTGRPPIKLFLTGCQILYTIADVPG